MRSLPDTYAMYPSAISRALCSAGITAGGAHTGVFGTRTRHDQLLSKGVMRSRFPTVGNCFIENSANQVRAGGNASRKTAPA
jgi:hypothetical protein